MHKKAETQLYTGILADQDPWHTDDAVIVCSLTTAGMNTLIHGKTEIQQDRNLWHSHIQITYLPVCSLSIRWVIRSMEASFSPNVCTYSCMAENSGGRFFIMYEALMLCKELVTRLINPWPCFLWALNSWEKKTKFTLVNSLKAKINMYNLMYYFM